MKLIPVDIKEYHVFVAAPGDMDAERRAVRDYFTEFNQAIGRQWGVRFEVVDWDNYSTSGVGRPQELVTEQTLERFKGSLALVIGIMGQRFGLPTGVAESGTEEEFNWAYESNKTRGLPEIKWFFQNFDRIVSSGGPR